MAVETNTQSIIKKTQKTKKNENLSVITPQISVKGLPKQMSQRDHKSKRTEFAGHLWAVTSVSMNLNPSNLGVNFSLGALFFPEKEENP